MPGELGSSKTTTSPEWIVVLWFGPRRRDVGPLDEKLSIRFSKNGSTFVASFEIGLKFSRSRFAEIQVEDLLTFLAEPPEPSGTRSFPGSRFSIILMRISSTESVGLNGIPQRWEATCAVDSSAPSTIGGSMMPVSEFQAPRPQRAASWNPTSHLIRHAPINREGVVFLLRRLVFCPGLPFHVEFLSFLSKNKFCAVRLDVEKSFTPAVSGLGRSKAFQLIIS